MRNNKWRVRFDGKEPLISSSRPDRKGSKTVDDFLYLGTVGLSDALQHRKDGSAASAVANVQRVVDILAGIEALFADRLRTVAETGGYDRETYSFSSEVKEVLSEALGRISRIRDDYKRKHDLEPAPPHPANPGANGDARNPAGD